MNNLNSVILEGNLVRDPDARATVNGTSICKYSIAVNRYYKQEGETQQEVSYFDVESWGKQAEICNRELEKGRGIRVVGRLKQDRWEAKDGSSQSRIKIVSEHVEFRPRKNKGQERSQKDSRERIPAF